MTPNGRSRPARARARRSSLRERSKTEGVDALRDEINRVDREILDRLAQRRRLSQRICGAKGQQPIRDTQREEDLLERLIQRGREHGLDAHFVTQVFHEIIDDSLRTQQGLLQQPVEDEPAPIRLAIQGIEGSYSHLAAQEFFSGQAERLSFEGLQTFAEVVREVEQGRADYAILPVENTTSGAINEVYDLLLNTRLSIVGEKKYRVEHCLVAGAGARVAQIRTIYSHPQAVAQCSEFLARLRDCKIEYFHDTAMSVSKIKDDGDPTQAAIASREAARQFGLHVVRRGIANQRENYTRFLVAARQPRPVDPRIPCKTSLVMATAQSPGSLVEALLVFRQHELNLTKLESRPIQGNPWEQMFYVDFEGNTADEHVRDAMDELTRVTRFVKILGTYPSEGSRRTSPPTRALTSGAARTPSADEAAPATPDESVPRATPRRKKSCLLASREHKSEDTIVEVGGVRIGGSDFVVMAGPCSVESAEQIMTCAREVKEYGGSILRGGCFKPRTSPHSFQGLGMEGLELMAEAGRRYGLPIITEVLAPGDVEAVAQYADILQIGARNMQNFTLLSEVGRLSRPVMLKRGLMSSIDELLHAAEYILAQGNQQVLLCERGIRTFETATRNTLDLSAVPVLLERAHLPVVVDPSHAAGRRTRVPPLARAARAVGAHAIIVEIHPEPEKALSDGPQALRFPQFQKLMADLFR
jgi:chorismate mutase/prephenate dehydratase